MPEQKDGQAPQGQPASGPAPRSTFDELYAKGWDEIEAAEAPKADAEKTPVEKLKEEPDCPDCPGGKPFKVIKHNGRDIVIKTEKEFNDYAQMGFDYTKKTQTLAEERRKLDAEREAGKSEYQQLLDRLERIEKGSVAERDGDNGKPRPAVGKPEDQQDTEAKVFEEYGLDPEYASDFEKKLVRDVVRMKHDSEGAREITQMIVLREMTKNISSALADAVKEYPVDDVVDEKGESLTGQQVIQSFRQVVTDPANQKTPVAELAIMAVKRVHDAQRAAKGATTVDDEMSPEEFMKRNPKLYQRILKAGGQGAVTDFLESQGDLPPTIDTRRGSVPSGEDRGKPKFKGLSEAIEAGMNDPEIKALFGG